jgi:hypothetical protein
MINAALLMALHTRPDLHAWPEPVVEMPGYRRLTAMGQWAKCLKVPEVSEPLVWYRGHQCRFVSAQGGSAFRLSPISGKAEELWDPPRRVPGGFENLADAWWSGRDLVVLQYLDEGFALYWLRDQESTPYRRVILPDELTRKFSSLDGPTFLASSTESLLQIEYYTKKKEFNTALISFRPDGAIRYEIRPFGWKGKFGGKDLIACDGLWWGGELLVRDYVTQIVRSDGVDVVTREDFQRICFQGDQARILRFPLPEGR